MTTTAYQAGNEIGIEAMQEALEGMVDRYSLSQVLDALCGVTIDKENHLRENWQDNKSARVWTNIGIAIQNVQIKAQERGI